MPARATPDFSAKHLHRVVMLGNLALLVLFPLAWVAPLMRAGFLPLFGLQEISVLSGIAALWQADRALAVLVAALAVVAPYAKTLALLAIHLSRARAGLAHGLAWLGRLAMADVFLIAVYIALARSAGLGRVETAWGLYLFTGCVLAALALAAATARLPAPHRPG